MFDVYQMIFGRMIKFDNVSTGWFFNHQKGVSAFFSKVSNLTTCLPRCLLVRCLLVWIFFAMASMYGIICLHLPPKLSKCR